VLCLGGCPRNGVAAIDGPGKARVRFANLTEDDAADLLAAAAAHERCASGEPAELDISDRLRGRISSVTLKRGVQAGAAVAFPPRLANPDVGRGGVGVQRHRWRA
jgi:hypothetical protein